MFGYQTGSGRADYRVVFATAGLCCWGMPAAAVDLTEFRWIQGGAGEGTELVAEGDARGAGCGTATLTQSNAPDTLGADGLWCGNAAANAETSLARQFVAPADLLLDCVQFGVLTNSGAGWPVQVRVLEGEISTPYAQLVELGSTTIQIPAGTNSQFVSANFSDLTIAAGTSFVVELRVPSRLLQNGGDNALLSLGCNASGETAPSYLRAPLCGAINFVPFQSIGFGHLALVMSVG